MKKQDENNEQILAASVKEEMADSETTKVSVSDTETEAAPGHLLGVPMQEEPTATVTAVAPGRTHLEELALKKRKKKILITAIVLAVIVLIVGIILLKKFVFTTEDEDTVTIEVDDDQTLEYGYISELVGNEMVYYVVEATEGSTESAQTEESMQGGPGEMSSGDAAGGMEAMSADGGMEAMSEDAATDMAAGSGEMPSGGADMAAGSGDATSESDTEESTESEITYTLTDEMISVTIPVSADVTTKLGTVTTFSRLAVGDLIAIVYEADEDGNNVIVAIYIVE